VIRLGAADLGCKRGERTILAARRAGICEPQQTKGKPDRVQVRGRDLGRPRTILDEAALGGRERSVDLGLERRSLLRSADMSAARAA
jgi:hypothetical protein